MPTPEKLAIVTGTTSGVGQALAQRLLAGAWRVVGIARRPAPIDHANYLHIAADLACHDELTTAVLPRLRSLLAAGELDRVALVNNAAAIGGLSWVSELDPGRVASLFAVNIQAPMVLMGLVAATVPDQVPVRVVNVSSGAAHTPLPGLADYCATKAALRLAGRTLAAEFERGGRTPAQAAVLSYEPGLVDTAMQDTARAADPERFPGHGQFQEFASSGLLNPPAAVVEEIVGFVESTPEEWFVERRFGG